MSSSHSRTDLSALSYVLITLASTILLLEIYGAEIIKYQLSHSGFFSYLNALKYSGFAQWDGLLPLTTFLICLTGGLCCAALCAVFLKASEAIINALCSLTSRSTRT